MKTRKMIAIFAALTLLGAGYVLADASNHESGNGENHMGHENSMGMMGDRMQEFHQTMMKQMDHLDTRLEEKLTVAKKARGDKKVDALIAVVEELVAQRRTMREEMMDMMPQMMGQMMQHMKPDGMMGMHRMMHGSNGE